MKGIREQLEKNNRHKYMGVSIETYRILILNFAVYDLVHSIAPEFGRVAENLSAYMVTAKQEDDFQKTLKEVDRYLKTYESSECEYNSTQVLSSLDNSDVSNTQSWKNRTRGVGRTSLL